MGISVIKVGLLVGAFILPLFAAVGSVCHFGKQYWSSKTGSCVDCTRCQNRYEVVIRPCQVHADTICGPISALKLEWPGHKHHDHRKQEDEETSNHHKNSHLHHHHHHTHDLNFHDLPTHDLDKDPLTNVEEWERLLKQSRAQLQHRKEDLMKSLLERKNAANHNNEWEEDDFEERNVDHHRSHELLTHRPHISKLDLEILERLQNNEHKHRNIRPLEPLSLVNDRLHTFDHKNEFEKIDSQNDFPELYDFMAVVPTHRLFLGEPPLIHEKRLDQNVHTLEQTVLSEKVPFTAAERIVWDWQAVALISAIVACLLFFALAAVYSILHARQWRRLKNHFNVDVEDLALRVSLMQNGGLNNPSSPDISHSNHYLEQLIAEKKIGENKSNIYIEKQPS